MKSKMILLASTLLLTACLQLERSVIVTAEVGDETYRFWVIDPQQVTTALEVAAHQKSLHPHGRIVRRFSKVNGPYTWHIDPKTAGFAEISMELCDGLPSYVEGDGWSGDYFCPWAATIKHIERYPFAQTFVSTEEAKAEFKKIFTE